MKWFVFVLMLFVLIVSVQALPVKPVAHVCGDELCNAGDVGAVEIRSSGDQATSIAFTAEEKHPVILDPKKKKMFYAEQDVLTGKLKRTGYRVGVDDPRALGIKKVTELTPEEIRRIKQRPDGFSLRDLPDEKRRELLKKQLIISTQNSNNVSSVGPTGNFVIKPADLKVLVLFVDFSDQTHTADFSFDEFNSFLEDFSEYYYKQSGGSLVLDIVSIENWYLANNLQEYYGGNYEANAPELIEELVPVADVDFSEFDSDSDGYMDGPVIVVHAGDPDENVGGNTDLIWSFYSSINGLEEDGVKIVDYILISENYNLGTLSHEFGHFMGLPDLYDTDPNDGESKGCGFFCLMAYGCYLDDVSSLSPWSKYYLGWNNGLNDVEISSKIDLGYNEFFKVDISDEEYFFVENKPVTDFFGEDVGGVLIWHVDETVMDNIGVWDGCSGTRMDCNVVNGEEEHKLVDLEEADDSGLDEWDDEIFDYGQKDDVWKYDCGILGCTNYLFDANSIPNSLSYDGEDDSISIEISSDVDEVMGVSVSLSGVEVGTSESFDLDFDRNGSEDSDTVMMRFGSINDSENVVEGSEAVEFGEGDSVVDASVEGKDTFWIWITVVIIVVITIVAVLIVVIWKKDSSG